MSSSIDEPEDDDPTGLEDEPVDCYTNFGIIEIENPQDPGAPPIVIDFEIQSDHPLSHSELEQEGLGIAAGRIGTLATYPDFARRFGTSPNFTIIPTGHVFGC